MNKMVVALLAGIVSTTPAFSQESDIRSACENDIKSPCSGVQPGGGRIKACVKEHKDQLSSGCKKALFDQAKQQSGKGRRRGSGDDSARASE